MSQDYRDEISARKQGTALGIKKQKERAAMITGADKRESSLSRNQKYLARRGSAPQNGKNRIPHKHLIPKKESPRRRWDNDGNEIFVKPEKSPPKPPQSAKHGESIFMKKKITAKPTENRFQAMKDMELEKKSNHI